MTEAGRNTLIGFGVGRPDYPGRDDINDRLRRAILAIEAEAVAQALAELRAEIEALPLRGLSTEPGPPAALLGRATILALIDRAALP